jgi:NADP-dependent 3-hydroxy acid dehydrogenase YdfG
MRNILILGASSPIGTALAEAFARGNSLILSGRRVQRLEEAAARCRSAGATSVSIAAAKLPADAEQIADMAIRQDVDLVIDTASATSVSRDHEIKPEELAEMIESDTCAHLRILGKISIAKGKHPDVVFISSILALVSTPSREIYSMMKRLGEIYLHKARTRHPQARILIYRVGKVIDSGSDSPAATTLANGVRRDFDAGLQEVLFGGTGHILKILNAVHPGLVSLAVTVQRLLRRN